MLVQKPSEVEAHLMLMAQHFKKVHHTNEVQRVANAHADSEPQPRTIRIERTAVSPVGQVKR